jgi:hypothetical protein
VTASYSLINWNRALRDRVQQNRIFSSTFKFSLSACCDIIPNLTESVRWEMSVRGEAITILRASLVSEAYKYFTILAESQAAVVVPLGASLAYLVYVSDRRFGPCKHPSSSSFACLVYVRFVAMLFRLNM